MNTNQNIDLTIPEYNGRVIIQDNVVYDDDRFIPDCGICDLIMWNMQAVMEIIGIIR